MDKLEATLPSNHAGLSVLGNLGSDGLRELTGIDSGVERARILAAIGSDPIQCLAPPPLGPNGEPVVVRPKVGFTNLSQVDTVAQTCHLRFFLDLYWHDPRMIGQLRVPDNIWRPSDCYILNQFDEMTRVLHDDRPTLIDSSTGLLLWPVELVGLLQNPMRLHAFPFDCDALEIHIHQNERSSRDEYLLRGYDADEDERASVRFFTGVFDDLTEFDVVGFSKECWEMVGGNQKEYSQMKVMLHLQRRWEYYAWKVSMPVLLCTVFSFSALFFPIDAEGSGTGGIFSDRIDDESLAERNNVAATMLLASSALLYVVASTLPKTSYLTTMDKFVLLNLAIQFAVGITSWLTCGVFFPVSNRAANLANLAMFIILFVLLVGLSIHILGRPMWHRWTYNPRAWPVTLARDVPSTRFFAFETFVNVFPPSAPGTKNPVALPEKQFGGTEAESGTELPITKLTTEPQRVSASPSAAARKSRGGSQKMEQTRELLSSNF